MLFLIYAKEQSKLQHLCETTRLATKLKLCFLEEEGIAVMKLPPQRPDKNPQENVWKIIGEKAQNRNPQNIDDLWGFLKEEWKSMTTPFFKKLFGSCGRRCNELIWCQGKFIYSLAYILIYQGFMMCFFTFDQGKMHRFVFFSWLLIYCKRKFRKLYM